MLAELLMVLALGAIDPHVTQENLHATICVPGYSAAVRPSRQWSAAMKTRLLKQARLPQAERSKFELDHIVPLGIGGCPKCPENLTLQPWYGPEGAYAKDKIENKLHRAVCRGALTLEEGQGCFLEQRWQNCR